MTDEEKAIDITFKSFELEKDKVEWFLSTYKNSRMSEIHTFYNGVIKGLAEGIKEAELHLLENWCRNEDDYCQHLKKLEKENAEHKALIEKMKCCEVCKNKKGWKGEKPCLDCKLNQFGEGTEDKWELAE